MRFYIVDCFAQEKYQGNQLAVFLPNRPMETQEMQQVAHEIGFSETAFLLSGKQENGGYDVRIFTPDVEVPFAGHPTLGTAYVIWKEIEGGETRQIRLNLKAGQIPVDMEGARLTMTQNQPQFGEILAKSLVAPALSLKLEDIRDDYPVQWVSTGLEAIMIPLKSTEAIEKCRVDFLERQRFIDKYYKCNLLVFAQESDRLRVRVFMDDTGFLEDPATGSANGCLAAYLLRHNYFHSQRISYEVSQGREIGRPSLLYVQAVLEQDMYTIQVGGKAVIVAHGEWL